MAAKKEESLKLEADKALAGILGLLVAQREEQTSERATPRKTEEILASAGLSAGEIASLTGKQPAAVRMSIKRSRDKNRRKRK